MRHQIRVLGRGSGDAVDMVMAHRLDDRTGLDEAMGRLLERLGRPRDGGSVTEATRLRRELSELCAGPGPEAPRLAGRLEPLAARLCRFFAMEDLHHAARAFESGQFQLAALLLEVASGSALEAIELEAGQKPDRNTGVLIHEARTVASGFLARTRAPGTLRPTIDTLRLVLESMVPRAPARVIDRE